MKIKLSRSQWEQMGKKAGWSKTASPFVLPSTEENTDGSTKIRATPDRAKNIENIAQWIKENFQEQKWLAEYDPSEVRRIHALLGYAEQLLIIADELKRFKGKVELDPRR
jgi:hypothetical protein